MIPSKDMGAENPTDWWGWIEPVKDWAESEPLFIGFLIGAVASAMLAIQMAKIFGPTEYEKLIKSCETRAKESEKEVKVVKREMAAKDRRIDKCHSQLSELKEELRAKKAELQEADTKFGKLEKELDEQ